MNIAEAEKQSITFLNKIYSKSEATKLADMLLEKITSFRFTQRRSMKEIVLNNEQCKQYNDYLNRLLKHEPIQYILQEAWFIDSKFFVNANVLIPRPETEELVMWINDTTQKNKEIKILDIGTGSGCIAVSLKKLLPKSLVTAVDISEKSIHITLKNARDNNVSIEVIQLDILDENCWSLLDKYDIIVSNPPYISKDEKKDIQKNVINYEPHTALFVENHNPLLFYEKILKFCQEYLQNDGLLFFEINERFGSDVLNLLQTNHFSEVFLKKDLQGKYRMIKGRLKKTY